MGGRSGQAIHVPLAALNIDRTSGEQSHFAGCAKAGSRKPLDCCLQRGTASRKRVSVSFLSAPRLSYLRNVKDLARNHLAMLSSSKRSQKWSERGQKQAPRHTIRAGASRP